MKWNIDVQPIFFPIKIRKIYDNIYKKNRLDFGNWIGKISINHKQNIDWWLTKPTLRNPYNSNLLNYCSVLETLKKLKIKKIEIITSSKEMGSIIFEHFNKKFDLKVNIDNNKMPFFRGCLPLYSFLKAIRPGISVSAREISFLPKSA